ncbi:polyphosphate polymerase domain-containing protein [Butyrivibrio sp. WCD2001]|uniref:polyphosphate polymerase domain-containing protein n=1 Tax=Butyrivibrio sp. WCD2001 TaxID=1280681 RepID=UPI000410BE2C|nr:polyphosphate polymerase domain-containing protein [Butyrivibrio sp. WCD2001]
MGDKYRHEYKYLVTDQQIEILKQRLNYLIPVDPHAGENKSYNIRSLYFDDYYNRCYYENLNGTDPREKFRIRIYNGSSSRITLECKRKERGKTLKTSTSLSVEQCEQLMRGQPIVEDIDNQHPVLRKLTMNMLLSNMRPAIIVGYDRIPYIYEMGNVRVTIDMNLFSSTNLDRFLAGNLSQRPVMPRGHHLLEVKWDEFIPDMIYRACQLDNLHQTAYSKYFLCRQYNM